MLIDTCNSLDSRKFNALISKVRARRWKLKPGLTIDKLERATSFLSEEQRKKILSLAPSERRYIKKMGKEEDSHLELEMLGIGEYCKSRTLIVSMEDSLDYVFYSVMGTPIEVLRALPNYQELSRGFIRNDIKDVDITYEQLMSIHPTIEYFILSEAEKFMEEVPLNDDNFLTEFNLHLIRIISNEVERILITIAVSIFESYPEAYVLRSRGCGVYVFTTDSEESLDIRLTHGDLNVFYSIKAKAYPAFGYLYEVDKEVVQCQI